SAQQHLDFSYTHSNATVCHNLNMRYFGLLALISAALFGTSSALVDARERTIVSQTSSAYDTRTTADGGCDPDGCRPNLTRDRSWAASSRWSCSEQLNGNQCTITYNFGTAQDIDRLKIKFYKGNERVRTLKITDNTGFQTTITSSGTANGYDNFDIYTDETSWLKMESLNLDNDEWISITEV
ncbi:unnamed protein product, partial [Scytosiphon promiscuus]